MAQYDFMRNAGKMHVLLRPAYGLGEEINEARFQRSTDHTHPPRFLVPMTEFTSETYLDNNNETYVEYNTERAHRLDASVNDPDIFEHWNEVIDAFQEALGDEQKKFVHAQILDTVGPNGEIGTATIQLHTEPKVARWHLARHDRDDTSYAVVGIVFRGNVVDIQLSDPVLRDRASLNGFGESNSKYFTGIVMISTNKYTQMKRTQEDERQFELTQILPLAVGPGGASSPVEVSAYRPGPRCPNDSDVESDIDGFSSDGTSDCTSSESSSASSSGGRANDSYESSRYETQSDSSSSGRQSNFVSRRGRGEKRRKEKKRNRNRNRNGGRDNY